MTWSARQLAELAGTTLETVRQYQQVGLLEEPQRAPNGDQRYRVSHLVRLLRIERLVDLGVPLSQIATVGRAGEGPEEVLKIIDAELGSSIDRLQDVRAELRQLLEDCGREP
jgi:DNA-binding transcriptional MerR regulator